jgi:ribonuclease BN (tRNA processing enzyme)
VRLTVLGSGPAIPQPDTPASGLLVETVSTKVLLDCGSGVVARLRALVDPRSIDGIVVGHLHADHFIDLTALRYSFPWPGTEVGRPAVWLPPGGRTQLATLAGLISERHGFFEDAFDVREYVDDRPFSIGELSIRPAPMRHYVPAWAMCVTAAGGERLVYGGDTGPTDRLAVAASGADILVAEATLASAVDDEPRRGHSTADEAIAMARCAGVGRVVLTHYPSARRAQLTALAAATPGIAVEVARPGLCLDVAAGRGYDRAPGNDSSSAAGDASAAAGGVAAGGVAAGGVAADAILPRTPSAAGSSPINPSTVRQ